MPLLARKRYLNLNHASVYAPAPSGGSFSGAGDVVSGAYAWYGLRGYNAAYATGSNPALDLVDQAGANPLTVNILANGRLDVASISTWVTANSVSTIKVTKLYDQTGNARHVLQATLANMPVLNLTGFGTLPAIVFTRANTQSLTTSASFTVSQPVTWSVVFKKNSSATSQELVEFLGNGPGIFLSGSNAVQLFSPTTSASVTVSDANWHAFQGVINTTSSATNVDASLTTGLNPGTGGAITAKIGIGEASFSNTFDGFLAESGIWNSAFTTTATTGQCDLVNANQHGLNGYNF